MKYFVEHLDQKYFKFFNQRTIHEY